MLKYVISKTSLCWNCPLKVFWAYTITTFGMPPCMVTRSSDHVAHWPWRRRWTGGARTEASSQTNIQCPRKSQKRDTVTPQTARQTLTCPEHGPATRHTLTNTLLTHFIFHKIACCPHACAYRLTYHHGQQEGAGRPAPCRPRGQSL